MSEKLNFAIDGEFLTNIARDWFWNMNKSYKKSNLVNLCEPTTIKSVR